MTSIQLKNAGIDLPILSTGSRSLRNSLLSVATGGQIKVRGGSKIVVRALDDVTLRFEKGTRVALVGHNGAGKSTLLRVMAGIYEPTEGDVAVHGKIASIFDISFGMDLDSSGWDNIILRGVFLGLSLDEIRRRQNEIGEMSELGEFLDMPIRTYSAGMTTRLAFAVSTSIRAEILLVDEAIGAGDAAFFKKAKQRLAGFIAHAGILVLASHSEELVREWCDTAVWMEHGRVRAQGPIDDILAAYRASVAEAQSLDAAI